MRVITPILSAIVVAGLFAAGVRLFGDFIPGEGMESLGNLLLLMGVGFTLLPPLAFAIAGRQVGLQRIAFAGVVMVVAQIVLLVATLMLFSQISAGVNDLFLLAALVVIAPLLSSLIALGVTGNLKGNNGG